MSQAPEPKTFAIDFDGTWTLDPTAWGAWYELMTQRGHTIILATGRHGWSEDMARAELPATMPIIYCKGEMKLPAVARAGHRVDVWIDDMPGMITESLILTGTLD